MRGKGQVVSQLVALTRITPAYAGKRASAAQISALLKDHPRVCGEKRLLHGGCIGLVGSPPRMRGKVCQEATKRRERRDHPRVCGEKSGWALLRRFLLGSPPRMRGKAAALLTYNQQYGITPAYAGKRQRHARPWTLPWDHPRVCGEKFASKNKLSAQIGSPPRMRGKVGYSPPYRRYTGITPAYAGKSLGSVRPSNTQ